MYDHNADVARAQSFLADVPETTSPSRPKPITKAELATVHTLKHGIGDNFKHITAIASTISYHESNTREAAQNVYLLIDDHTPDGADVEPMLAQAYQSLTKAAQLLFEAQTHILRYVNRLENGRLHQAEMFAEHDPIGNHGI